MMWQNCFGVQIDFEMITKYGPCNRSKSQPTPCDRKMGISEWQSIDLQMLFQVQIERRRSNYILVLENFINLYAADRVLAEKKSEVYSKILEDVESLSSRLDRIRVASEERKLFFFSKECQFYGFVMFQKHPHRVFGIGELRTQQCKKLSTWATSSNPMRKVVVEFFFVVSKPLGSSPMSSEFFVANMKSFGFWIEWKHDNYSDYSTYTRFAVDKLNSKKIDWIKISPALRFIWYSVADNRFVGRVFVLVECSVFDRCIRRCSLK